VPLASFFDSSTPASAVVAPSESGIKKQDGNVNGRYGPYKTKDIVAFEDFMSRLPIKAKQMDPESTERIISDYFPDTMAMVRLFPRSS
jgi:hypothetical protein